MKSYLVVDVLCGPVLVAAVFAVLSPLIYCPCTGHELWLGYIQLGGFFAWLTLALVGIFFADKSERTIYVVALLAAPCVYLGMLSLGVST